MNRDTRAGHWYARMHGPDADSSRAAFETWMGDPANAAAYAAYEDDRELTGELPAAFRARSRAEREASRFAFGGSQWAMASAAAIALLLVIGWQFSQRGDTPQIASGPMLPGELRLADGSHVTLMDGAWAEPKFTDTERRLVLHGGRARFVVAHDAGRPFIVVAGNSETTALGTIFEIDTRAAVARIKLVRGAVEVRRAGTAKAVRLAPGESAEVTARGARRLPAPRDATQTTMIEADNLPLGAVIDRANRTNAVPIRLADPALAAHKLTGEFDVADSRALARKLAAALDLKVKEGSDQIILKAPEEKRGG